MFLFEAIGVGLPIVTNDDPPMNEVVEDGLNGLLVGSRPDGLASLGIAAVLPDVDDMARAIARLGDQGLRDQLQAGAIEMRERLDWRHTVEGFLASSSGSSPELLQMGESCRSRTLANASLTECLTWPAYGHPDSEHHVCGGGHRHRRADRARPRSRRPPTRASTVRRTGWKPRIDKRHKELYDGLWRRKVSPENKRWARRVAACESGMNPDALGADGIYRGAFQFGEGTWKSGAAVTRWRPDCLQLTNHAFVAVRLKGRDGAGHWPNCP